MECEPCTRAVEEAWFGPIDGTHCKKCHRTWSSIKEAHCPMCCRHFSSDTAAQAHKRGVDRVSCVDPSKVGPTEENPTRKRLEAFEGPSGTTWRFETEEGGV